MSSDYNQDTIHSYNSNIQKYFDAEQPLAEGVHKQWIDYTCELLPAQATVFEIGTATGRDARYLESKGLLVTKTDASDGFIKRDPTIKKFNLLQDKINNKYDLIFANAVLLHLKEADIANALKVIKEGLKPNGYFSFSLKKGSGSLVSSHKLDAPRFFTLWSEEFITLKLDKSGLQVERIFEDTKWLMLVAKLK